MNEHTTSPMVDDLPISEVGEHLRTVALGAETAIDVIRETLGADGKPLDGQTPQRVTVSLIRRQVNPEAPAAPIRAPSPRRTHTFHDCTGFAEYIKKYGTADCVILCDLANGEMAAVLDENSTTGFEIIRFKAITHPLFAPWEQLFAKKEIAIKEFAEFIALNRRVIVDPNAKDVTLAASQVRMCRSVEMHQGQSRASLNGVLVTTRISGAATGTAERSDYIDFPETITIKTPILLDADASQLEVDLVVTGSETTGVVIRANSPDLAQRKMELFERMKNEIIAVTQEKKVTFAMGSVKHEDWKYLPPVKA